MKTIVTALALALQIAPAFAAPSPRNAPVQTGDLNLASERGQEILALRIHRAARALCTGDAVDRLPQTLRSERACIRDAETRALAATRTLPLAGQANPARSRLAQAPRRD